MSANSNSNINSANSDVNVNKNVKIRVEWSRRQSRQAMMMVLMLLLAMFVLVPMEHNFKALPSLMSMSLLTNTRNETQQQQQQQQQQQVVVVDVNNTLVTTTTATATSTSTSTTQGLFWPWNNTNSNSRTVYVSASVKERITDFFQEIQRSKNLDYATDEIAWIQEYLFWHNEMRLKFPQADIFNDPNAPEVAISYQYRSRGGFTDRFKDIGHLMQQCHQTQRVLFLVWYQAPRALEEFLVPNLFNWSLPYQMQLTNSEKLQAFGDANKKLKLLENGKPSLGNFLHPFPVIWHSFFRPSGRVQTLIDEAMSVHQLRTNQFDAVHLRLGHPAFVRQAAFTEENKHSDKFGYAFYKDDKSVQAMDSASHAVECAQWLATTSTQYVDSNSNSNSTTFPLYFYADSPALIQTVVNSSSFYQRYTYTNSLDSEELSTSYYLSDAIRTALNRLTNTTRNYPNRIEGRTNASISHLARKVYGGIDHDEDDEDDEDLDAFCDTFVDLYIGAQARCISIGVGRFAYAAAKISGTTCLTRHFRSSKKVAAKWGMTGVMQRVPKCPIPAHRD
jgi:hypothetical protein